MNMKFCPNYGCVAYGRVVYTQATRCVFCRWDLKPPRMKSEMVETTPSPATNAEGWRPPAEGWAGQETNALGEVSRMPTQARGQRRAPMRHSV
jgi:hypothetical protein